MAQILILGATGMLGHTLWGACRERLDTCATVRAASPQALPGELHAEADEGAGVIADVRAERFETVERALDAARPEVVVNCIGVVKQLAVEPAAMVALNALFPHQLAAACAARGIRLIHLSTDCVFSGRGGGYAAEETPDPVDLYGRSKLCGEPSGPLALTLRTSMIGWELGGRRQGLLEWFVAQRGGTVRGYTRAVFTGPTTPVLARAILAAVAHPELTGTWHVAAEPIAKYDLLVALRDALELEVEIVPDEGVAVDRSLDGAAFTAATGWAAPPWEEMLAELAAAAPARALGQGVAGR